MRLASCLAFLAVFGIVACAADTKDTSRNPKLTEKDKDDEETSEDESNSDDDSDTSTRSTSTDTQATTEEASTDRGPDPVEKPAFPRDAAATECTAGNGLYCAGHGVDNGTAGTLYRCADGKISEEKKCATACLFLGTGAKDACDGDGTKCPRGSGLYCGTNYLSADAKTLYRCTSGSVSVEQACATSCVKEPDGTPDRCE